MRDTERTRLANACTRLAKGFTAGAVENAPQQGYMAGAIVPPPTVHLPNAAAPSR
jgi:hypothetical protein